MTFGNCEFNTIRFPCKFLYIQCQLVSQCCATSWYWTSVDIIKLHAKCIILKLFDVPASVNIICGGENEDGHKIYRRALRTLILLQCMPRRNRLQLKCGGTRWHTGEEMKGKLANGVGSHYPSNYLGIWCIQHYYRWWAQLGWTDAPADLNVLVRFAERRNLVSARVPSHFKRSLPCYTPNKHMEYVSRPRNLIRSGVHRYLLCYYICIY